MQYLLQGLPKKEPYSFHKVKEQAIVYRFVSLMLIFCPSHFSILDSTTDWFDVRWRWPFPSCSLPFAAAKSLLLSLWALYKAPAISKNVSMTKLRAGNLLLVRFRLSASNSGKAAIWFFEIRYSTSSTLYLQPLDIEKDLSPSTISSCRLEWTVRFFKSEHYIQLDGNDLNV